MINLKILLPVILILTIQAPVVFGQTVPLFWGTMRDGNDTNYTSGNGTIFNFDVTSVTYTTEHVLNYTEGKMPYGSLIQYGGSLYGSTSQGTAGSNGCLFRFDILTHTYTNIISLGVTVGWQPQGNMIVYNNTLYGLTRSGGAGTGDDDHSGVLYSIDPATNTYTILHSFTTTTGTAPIGGLTACNNKFYGTTSTGGVNGYGVLFEFDPQTNAYSEMVDLTYDAYQSVGELVLLNDTLYGTTSGGGFDGRGSIFSYYPGSNTITTIHGFTDSTGQYIYSGLTPLNGKLYGNTNLGGAHGRGVLFSFDPVSQAYTQLHAFDLTTGAFPWSGMIVHDSLLYGTTLGGGIDSVGVLFSFNPNDTSYTKLLDFGPGVLFSNKLLEVDSLTPPPPPAGIVNVHDNEAMFAVYPNPATQLLSVKFPATVTDISFQLRSNNGQVMIDEKLTAQNNKINVGTLSPGIYLYSIADASGHVLQQGKLSKK